MDDMTEDEIAMAFRQRIQRIALCHRVGQSVAGHVIMRFRKLGEWTKEIVQTTPRDIVRILTQTDHPQRLPLPDGPLVVIVENENAGILEVSEHLLSQDVNIRRAAYQHFLSAQSNQECWVSAYVLDLLQKNADALMDADESIWIPAGLLLRDAIELDFRANCAGVHQSSQEGFDQSYQKYLNKVIWPRANCFEHDRPTIINPIEESQQIRTKLNELSSLDDLNSALNGYLAFCGYLPLAGELSAGSLIAAWDALHPGHDLWKAVWGWADSIHSVLAQYHAAHAFLEHPQWIREEEIERLITVVRSVISSPEADSNSTQSCLLRLRANLLEHFQMHLEGLAPGLNSDVVATSACWMTETVAQLFRGDSSHIMKGCAFLRANVIPISQRRWSMARSRMAPTPLRIASLYNPFIWSDALLATAVRRFSDFPECDNGAEYGRFLLTRLTSATCAGALRVIGRRDSVYAFELPVSPSHLALPASPSDDKDIEAARQMLAARFAIEEGNGVTNILSELRELSDGPSGFVCANLCRWVMEPNFTESTVRDLLNDDEWRRTVFQRLPLASLHNLVSFLTDWQLQQDDEWLVRLPHFFAFECEKAAEPDRKELLLAGTFVSTMAADIASPIVRLLAGAQRSEFAGLINNWQQTTREIARGSEPWLAARVRGLLGTIENHL
ncbi:hypothetical protein [Schlesneria sp. T3-172]|uniref:hypothetical protein n=1 Tax=Schlesneria sphaerica TaxID=3373610 RepID=UPI0037C7A960